MFAQWLGPGVASVSWGWQALSKEHTRCPRLSLIWAREVPCSMRNISLSKLQLLSRVESERLPESLSLQQTRSRMCPPSRAGYALFARKCSSSHVPLCSPCPDTLCHSPPQSNAGFSGAPVTGGRELWAMRVGCLLRPHEASNGLTEGEWTCSRTLGLRRKPLRPLDVVTCKRT